MEEPLNDAINYVHALQLLGRALDAVRTAEGRPVEILACTTIDRLTALKQTWSKLLKTMPRV